MANINGVNTSPIPNDVRQDGRTERTGKDDKKAIQESRQADRADNRKAIELRRERAVQESRQAAINAEKAVQESRREKEVQESRRADKDEEIRDRGDSGVDIRV